MDLQELKVLVDYAIDDCQRIIQKDPKTVLSEGDFERLLSDCISKRIGYNPGILVPNEFAVHTQLSHYNQEKKERDAQVDILLTKPENITIDLSVNKKFKIYNTAESFAIELKYRHDKNKGCVTAAKQDIDKFIKYKDESFYYSIILLDRNNFTSRHKRNILDYYNTKINELGEGYENKFYCKVLVKEAE